MNKLNWMGMIAMGSLAWNGCAHTAAERALDGKASQETAIKSRADLGAESDRLLQAAPNLTDDQRSRLGALRDAIRGQNDSLIADSQKLRSVLIKDILSPNYDEREVSLIKKRIRDIEDKRVAILFDGIDQANEILGRQAIYNRGTLERMFEIRGALGE